MDKVGENARRAAVLSRILFPLSNCQVRADRVVLQAAGRRRSFTVGVVTSCWEVTSLITLLVRRICALCPAWVVDDG